MPGGGRRWIGGRRSRNYRINAEASVRFTRCGSIKTSAAKIVRLPYGLARWSATIEDWEQT
jgi:hypothetical protein